MNHFLIMLIVLGPSVTLMANSRNLLHQYHATYPDETVWPFALFIMALIAVLPFLIFALVVPILGLNPIR